MLKVLGFLLLFPVCLLSSQYLSSFYVTEPKWYNAYIYDSNATVYEFYGGYSLELAQVHCARKCSQFDNCTTFSIYGWDMYWKCLLLNNNYCMSREKTLIGLTGSITWDKIKDTPNKASSCMRKSGILNSGNPTDYCQFIRPGCFGEDCMNCPSSCSDCFVLKSMSKIIDYECTLWVWNYTTPPIPGVKCYGSSQYALARKLNRDNGEGISGRTIGRPYNPPQNFTWLQRMASASTQAHFVLSGEPINNTTYEAIYKNFQIFENGTLRMSFVSGNASDGFNFGSNINGTISLQFVWPSDRSKCGPYWYKASDESCPTDRVILWDESDLSNKYYGIRWPTLSTTATYNMSVFKLYFT